MEYKKPRSLSNILVSFIMPRKTVDNNVKLLSSNPINVYSNSQKILTRKSILK